MKIQATGKWVLAGEHSVLCGLPAIALPLNSYRLELRVEPSPSTTLEVKPAPISQTVLDVLDWARQKSRQGFLFSDLEGSLILEGNIPVSAGLGSSAALSVVLARWILSRSQKESPEKVWDLATQFENFFHGKSSGMDTAVVTLGQPIEFTLEQGAHPVEVKRIPHFTFHDTGLRAETRDCVAHVQSLGRSAEVGHEKMKRASELAKEGLRLYDQNRDSLGKAQIAEAMKLSQESFRSWGLLTPEMEAQERDLYARGAEGVKLTGAGRGGFLVALGLD